MKFARLLVLASVAACSSQPTWGVDNKLVDYYPDCAGSPRDQISAHAAHVAGLR